MIFFFNDTATTEIYTLSLHDALPISHAARELVRVLVNALRRGRNLDQLQHARSEEHTSELQSLAYLVCRLLLEKKKLNILSRRTGKAVTRQPVLDGIITTIMATISSL